jgi:membrane associated rhomboid family serine protease
LIGAERVFPIRDLNPTRITPVLTLLVIVANVVVFFLFQPMTPREGVTFSLQHAAIACELTTGEPLTSAEFLSGRCETASRGAPIFPEKRLALSVLVSLFLHGGLLHLLGNMWFLWVFGNNVEDELGRVRFLLFYVACGIAAALAQTLLSAAAGDVLVPMVGASGAIAGVLAAYMVFFPHARVLTAIPILIVIRLVYLPAGFFIGAWFVLQLLQALLGGTGSGVAFFAHVGGFVFGWLLVKVRTRLRARTTGR